MENESFYFRNLEYEKTDKNMKIQKMFVNRNTEFYNNEKYKKMEKFSAFTVLQKFYNIDFFENAGKIYVIRKYEKTKFYNIDDLVWRLMRNTYDREVPVLFQQGVDLMLYHDPILVALL